MSEHYYTRNPSSEHDLREVRFTVFDTEFAFVTDAGVFSRDGIAMPCCPLRMYANGSRT